METVKSIIAQAIMIIQFIWIIAMIAGLIINKKTDQLRMHKFGTKEERLGRYAIVILLYIVPGVVLFILFSILKRL